MLVVQKMFGGLSLKKRKDCMILEVVNVLDGCQSLVLDAAPLELIDSQITTKWIELKMSNSY